MKRILVISWFFPPLNSSEAVLSWKLLSHSRYPCDVFTQRSSDSWAYGTEHGWPTADRLRRFYGKSASIDAWAEEAVAFFLAHREDYALLMTRSMPPECHRAGLRIQALCPGLPWVASFGDPIWKNPYELLGGGLYNPWRRPLRAMLWALRHRAALRRARTLRELETKTLARADRLLFNNDSQLRYMAAGAEGRAVVIPHSYDPALYPAAAPRSGDRLRFVFTGQLNALRSALPLLRAIRRLKEARPDLPRRAEFLFFGELPDGDLAYILRHALTDTVSVRPPISYRQSLAEIKAADWLLHIDANIAAVTEENVFFAGKLADYFGAGRPILAVTMPRGAAAETLRRAGAVVTSFSVNEIKQALDRIVSGELEAPMDAAFLRRFSAEAAARIFDEQVVTPLLCQANTPET